MLRCLCFPTNQNKINQLLFCVLANFLKVEGLRPVNSLNRLTKLERDLKPTLSATACIVQLSYSDSVPNRRHASLSRISLRRVRKPLLVDAFITYESIYRLMPVAEAKLSILNESEKICGEDCINSMTSFIISFLCSSVRSNLELGSSEALSCRIWPDALSEFSWIDGWMLEVAASVVIGFKGSD